MGGQQARLYMSDWEIMESYKNAIDRRVQIRILAELNLTTFEEICDVLRRGGVSVLPPKHPGRGKYTHKSRRKGG